MDNTSNIRPSLANGAAAVGNADEDWHRWSDRLSVAFNGLSDDDAPVFLYLLADGRSKPGIDKLLALVPRLKYASLWRDSALEPYADIAPYLISINRYELENERALQHRLVRRLWREAAELPMLAWLWSPCDFDTLDAHFRRYCTYALPNRRQFYLHFYDNRILARLRQVWSPEEQQQFIEPCCEIWYRDRWLADVEWRNPVAPMHVERQALHSMTDEQHRLLLALGYADKLALQLRHVCGAAVAHLSERGLYERVSEQLQRASAYRVEGEADLARYVTTGVVVAQRFDAHPLIRERLQGAMRGEMTLDAAFGAIGQDVWDAVREAHEDE